MTAGRLAAGVSPRHVVGCDKTPSACMTGTDGEALQHGFAQASCRTANCTASRSVSSKIPGVLLRSAWRADHHHGGAPTSRGSLLQGVDSIAARQYQLELGICGAVRDDGVELLQVQLAPCETATPHRKRMVIDQSDGKCTHRKRWAGSSHMGQAGLQAS